VAKNSGKERGDSEDGDGRNHQGHAQDQGPRDYQSGVATGKRPPQVTADIVIGWAALLIRLAVGVFGFWFLVSVSFSILLQRLLLYMESRMSSSTASNSSTFSSLPCSGLVCGGELPTAVFSVVVVIVDVGTIPALRGDAGTARGDEETPVGGGGPFINSSRV